jgi:hypothetical protein
MAKAVYPLAKLALAKGKMVPLYSLLCRACSDTELEDTCTAEVLSDQRLATRSVEKSTGKPGDGNPKLDGSRVQAVY